MILSNRRDAGYTIISRFEQSLRNYISNVLTNTTADFRLLVPSGVINKARERYGAADFDNIDEILENSDFPDLKEIALYQSNFQILIGDKLTREDFIEEMDELYTLRCKIAHIKGFFTSIDLDKLIELSADIAAIFNDREFMRLINAINEDPGSVIVKIPSDFIIDQLEANGIINNIPVPDYEFEGGFVGREADRKKIIQYLNADKFAVITVTGAGGVGKTALALRVIQELTQKPKQRPFDAIIWLSAKENKLTALGIEDIEPTLRSYEELLDTIIEVLGFDSEKPIDIEKKESLVKSIIDLSNKLLVVIDNLETITDERIINFIIEAPLKVKFLITSRKGIGQIEIRHELKQLKEKEAIYLFRQLAKDKQLTSLLPLKDETIKKYVEKVSYYPLAIKWVIGQIARGKDINRIIDSIRDTESDISRFCFEQIFNSLPEDSKNILFAICCFDEDPTSSLLQYVVGQTDEIFDKSVEELILVSLIIPEQFQNEKNSISRKFSMLSLTKGYVRLQLNKNSSKKNQIVKRIIEVENTITITEKAKKEYRHSLHNLGALTDEEKVAAILAQAAFQKYQSGRYEEATEDYKKAIKIAPGFSAIYRNWGVMESYEGHLQEADKLMEKAENLNDQDPQIYLLWGNILRKNGKHHEAVKKYEKAHELDCDDHIILNALGTAKGKLGEYAKANEYLQKAIKTKLSIESTKHEIINKTAIADNLINWGDALLKDRNFDEANRKLTEAIVILKNLKDFGPDPKIYSALTKATLRKAFFHIRQNQNTQAAYYLNSVFNSTPRTFNHHVYKIKAGLELAEILLNEGNSEKAKTIIKEIEQNYKGSEIFRRPNTEALYGKYNELKSQLFNAEKIRGKISKVNLASNYVIISNDNNEEDTYIANNEDFIPRLSLLSKELRDKSVLFTPIEKETNNGKKKQAKFIRLV